LPGLRIYPRKGHGSLPEDKPFMGKLFLSCPARAYLENFRKSRARKGRVARTLSRQEIEGKLETLLQLAGPEALLSLRKEASKITSQLHTAKELKALNGLIGALLGTRKVKITSPIALARIQGQPYDAKRLDLFQKLYESLAKIPSMSRTISHAGTALPFFEAYFSNFIEGTEFEVEEAAKIIFEGKIPKDRPKDAHDIIGTYQITSDEKEMKQIPRDEDELIKLLKTRHACLMQSRPEVRPGQFKTVVTRAGMTFFVAPELVEGTLRKGFQWLKALESPFQKAVYMMFLITEIHPFVDGNGRCARLMMNSELVGTGQARIIIPTVFRNNYLAALKTLSQNDRADPLIRVLDFAQHYTSLIDWSNFQRAQKMLQETHAFEDSSTADLMGNRLQLPKPKK
jgi:Fic family protein